MRRYDALVDRGTDGRSGGRVSDGAVDAPAGHGPITLGLVLACLAGTLLVGAVHKAPCAGGDWADGRQYRLACYTDIVPLFGTEQLAGGRLPYLDACAPSQSNCDEYPVLTMYLMRAAGWISGDDAGRFFWVNALLLSAFAACGGGLPLPDGRTPRVVVRPRPDAGRAAVRELGPAGRRARDGGDARLLPPPGRMGRRADRPRSGGEALPGTAAHPVRGRTAPRAAAGSRDPPVVVGRSDLGRGRTSPSPTAGLSGWWEFFRFNGARPADWDSGWYLLCRSLSVCPSTGWINVSSIALLVALVAWVWMAKRRREPDFPRWQLAFPILVLFLLVGKVYSPQFSLWLLPWLVLVLPGPRRFLAFEAADLAVFLDALLVLRRPDRHRRAAPVGLRDRGADPRGGPRLVRGRLGPGAEPPAARRASHRPGAVGGARVSGRRRLLDGLRPCLAVFLAARIGLSLLSVVAVHLVDPLDPVDVPGRAGPPATPGWHNAVDATERQDAVWYLRLADEGWSTDDASAAFFPLYPLTVRAVAWVLPGDDAPRRPPRLEPRVPGCAARALRADGRGLRRPRRAAGDRGGGDLPDVLLLPRPLHRVPVPAPLRARVPRVPPRSLGTGRGLRRARGAHPERRHPPRPRAPRGSVLPWAAR